VDAVHTINAVEAILAIDTVDADITNYANNARGYSPKCSRLTIAYRGYFTGNTRRCS
jgi:hypothetical protein